MTWTKNWRRNWRSGNRHNWRGPSFDAAIGGTTPEGAATFVLDIENNYTVKFDWKTNIIPSASGVEAQRFARNNRGRETYTGKAWLLGDAVQIVRTKLAKYAAAATVFLLALPHEELLLGADNDGATVYPNQIGLSDCMRIGQRVVVYRENDEGELQSIDAVIQLVVGNAVTLDVDPGELGLEGGRITPARPIYFDPQQNFGRIESTEESWDFVARAIDFDYARQLATLALGPITVSAGFDGLRVVCKTTGIGTFFELENGGAGIGAGELSEAFGVVTFRFEPDVTTLQDLFDALAGSVFVALAGPFNPADTIAAGDAFFATELTGAEAQGVVGTGATLDEYDGKPVWTWPIRVEGSVTDTLHAMTKIIDMGGQPYAIGVADVADWGRAVAILSGERYDWQWFKLFMTEVRGAQRTWWYPSWRNDLTFVSKAANTITVTGDVDVWYPRQRQHVQIIETSGVVTRAEISEAEDNGDGTWTLTIGTTLASSAVRMISWLELCRFERDEFPVVCGQHGFAFASIARAVQA